MFFLRPQLWQRPVAFQRLRAVDLDSPRRRLGAARAMFKVRGAAEADDGVRGEALGPVGFDGVALDRAGIAKAPEKEVAARWVRRAATR